MPSLLRLGRPLKLVVEGISELVRTCKSIVLSNPSEEHRCQESIDVSVVRLVQFVLLLSCKLSGRAVIRCSEAQRAYILLMIVLLHASI